MSRKKGQILETENAHAISRRNFVRLGAGLGGLALAAGTGIARAFDKTVDLPIVNGKRLYGTYPQKRPMIIMSERPPLLETPFHIFNDGIVTPNDAFFVRWHLAGIPTTIDEGKFRIHVHGGVKKELSLSVADLKKNFEAVELTAVCQCSGNGRGLFSPRVPGGQWTNGAMGNAVWRGVRLRDVLNKAGVAPDAVQVQFNGAETPVLASTPDFMKSLDMDIATGDDVIIAYSMNGENLPVLNGFPVRLVVPGWYATYWVKMLDDIEVISKPANNFWMNPAYRIPANACACQMPGETNVKTVPINRMNVRSFITSLASGARIHGGHTEVVKGIAFDGGSGIRKVLFSTDGGKTWADARLDKNHGKYSFRGWEAAFTPRKGHAYELMALAINNNGESQQIGISRWNPAGFMRNEVETVRVTAI